MKKSVCFLLIFLFCAATLSGQSTSDSNIFVKSVGIVKILTHELGYIILYEKQKSSIGELYIPYTWFNKSGGTGELVWGKDTSFPFFSVYWVDGKFDHIKLYLQENPDHPSWGRSTKPVSDLKDKFNITKDNFVVEF